MSTGAITFLVILVVLTAVLIALYLFGRKMQKRQEEQQIQLQAAAQQISMFVIDKKKLKMKESGLPAQVIEQTPRLMRGSKVPILKVKVGPQIMNLMCDAQIFDSVPMRKEGNGQRNLCHRRPRHARQAGSCPQKAVRAAGLG